jgi:hypothetical protein
MPTVTGTRRKPARAPGGATGQSPRPLSAKALLEKKLGELLKGKTFSEHVSTAESGGYSRARPPTQAEKMAVLFDWVAAKHGPELVKGRTFSTFVSGSESGGYSAARQPTLADYQKALDARLDAQAKKVTTQVWVSSGESGYSESRTSVDPASRQKVFEALAVKLIRAEAP